MTIKILDNSLINKIAAGEVIERPASVVKELLENSIDSGADEIKIEIENSGLKKIKITDNGSGMSKEDLLLSYKRHATSKIKNEKDLFNILSLGFRGEALASIAEISNLKISTKRKEDLIGTSIEIEAGKIIKESPESCSDGTTVEVNDLFFNVPARKKYLKSNDVEFNSILKIITKASLINKNISLKLIKDDKEILNSQKTNYLLNKIIFIYGTEISKELIKVHHSEEDIEITGYISKPNLTRADKSDQTLFVNSRPVKDNVISKAIYDAYKTLLFINRHPVFVLKIKIHPNEIDVNVHPAKEQIRIKNEEKISKIIYNAISKSFKENNLIYSANLDSEISAKAQKNYDFSIDKQTTLEVKEEKNDYNKEKEIIISKNKIGPFKILGQINKTFIVAESPEGLTIIDQHAAEERVNYEKFIEEKKTNSIKTQTLLTPRILELNPTQYSIALNNQNFLKKLGYDFEDFGENTIKLSIVPEIFGRLKTILFLDILNELEKNKGGIINSEIEYRIIRFACRASIKAGDELTNFQIRKLINKLEQCNNPYTCPHGRPTIINFNIGDLEKKFKRTGW